MAGRGVQMRMPSRPAAIAPMIDRILAAVEPAGFSAGQRDDLAVALAEALANAVVHGNRRRARAFVAVGVLVEPRKGATVTVKDTGQGFARDAVPDPREPDALMLPRGRGVFLMRRLMDAVEYNRKGNEVRLTLRRRARRRPRRRVERVA
jgi:anti-sigma regulatory factor (Ser/Thr protein kinase)